MVKILGRKIPNDLWFAGFATTLFFVSVENARQNYRAKYLTPAFPPPTFPPSFPPPSPLPPLPYSPPPYVFEFQNPFTSQSYAASISNSGKFYQCRNETKRSLEVYVQNFPTSPAERFIGFFLVDSEDFLGTTDVESWESIVKTSSKYARLSNFKTTFTTCVYDNLYIKARLFDGVDFRHGLSLSVNTLKPSEYIYAFIEDQKDIFVTVDPRLYALPSWTSLVQYPIPRRILLHRDDYTSKVSPLHQTSFILSIQANNSWAVISKIPSHNQIYGISAPYRMNNKQHICINFFNPRGEEVTLVQEINGIESPGSLGLELFSIFS